MRQLLYGIKDLKAGAFTFPIYEAPSRGVGIRIFQGGIRQKDSQLSEYPNDFELWELGMVDKETGTLSGNPIALGTAFSFTEEAPR